MRKWQHKALAWSLAIAVAGTIFAGFQAQAAVDIASALKLFGISYVVDLCSKDLDSFINAITMNKSLGKGEATKVVPIVSVGNGAYVGAAQVTGPAAQVAKVQAVGQLEGAFFADAARAKALIPFDSRNPLQGMRRVEQVGVSAIIDISIESPAPPPTKTDPAPGGGLSPTKRDPAPPKSEQDVLKRYPALGYAIYAREDIQVSGNSFSANGDLRAGDDVYIKGNKAVIRGEVIAGDRVESHSKWTGRWRRASGLPLPQFSWTDLKRRASKTYSSITLKSGSSVQGVVAVDGDLLLDGRLKGGGVVIVRGDVVITKRGAGADQGLLIWAGGDVRISESGADINAVVISAGDIKVSGNNVKARGGLIGRSVYLTGNNISVTGDSKAVGHLPIG